MSVLRQFLRFTVPTVAAMLVNGLYQVVDGIFIGHYIGAAGLAAINVAWPVIGTTLGIGMMVGVGCGALASIRQGEGDIEQARRILATGLMSLIVLAPCVAAVLWWLADDFLRWQGVEGQVLQLGLQYLQVLMLSCVFSLGSIAMPFLLRNDDSPNLATLLMMLGALINIVLDYVLIAVAGWELTGAAIATAVAQMVVSVLGMSYFFSRRANMRLTRACLRFDWHYVPKMLHIGASSLFMYAYGAIMVAIHNSVIMHYGDEVLVGAYAMLGYIIVVYYFTAEGIASGMQPLASFYYGAGQNDNLRRLLKLAMSVAVLGGMVFVVLLNLFSEQVISIFNSDDARLLQGASFALTLHLSALYLDGFLVVCAAFYQATNQGNRAMFVTIGNIVLQLPFLFVLPKLWGMTGVWLAFPISNLALSLVVAVMLWRSLRRMNLVQRPLPV